MKLIFLLFTLFFIACKLPSPIDTAPMEIIPCDPAPIGTITKFHKANNEGEPDEYIYVVTYKFYNVADAVEYLNRGK